MKVGTGTVYAVRGVLALLAGVLLLLLPSASLPLVTLLGAYFLLEGTAAIIFGGGRTETGKTRWYLLSGGVIDLCWAALIFIVAGMFGFFFPQVRIVLVFYVVFSRTILIGLFELLAGLLRREGGAVSLRLATGALSIVFGLAMIYLYRERSLAFVVPLGVYYTLLGIVLLVVSLIVSTATRGLLSGERESRRT
jgi:uncharacterized membrane protein HdeD (DUF308 family)